MNINKKNLEETNFENKIYTIEEIKDLAKSGKLEDWIHHFLNTTWNNSWLSEGLKQVKRYWTGPVEVKLNNLIRDCWPEPEMTYFEPKENWDKRVESKKKIIENDEYEQAPFIAQFIDWKFQLKDWSHRLEAYKQLWYKKYWTIIWSDTKAEDALLKIKFNKEN